MTDLISALSVAVAALVACLFLASGIARLRNPQRTMQAVAGYGLLPDAMLPLVAHTLPVAEILLALALFAAPFSFAVRCAAALVLLLFAGAVASALARGMQGLDCGCGGTPRSISAGLVWRNVGLAAALLLPGAALSAGVHAAALMAAAIAFVLMTALETLQMPASLLR